ncbi:MAG TPA: ABC transporter permease [Acidimicrobiia bacterium]|nr:ABC transporter permease [Acidimicrobiia bacterium]
MTTTLPVYDSAQPRTTPASLFTNLITYRGLLRLLVRRELTIRYKRSTLGVWWTLLNPLLTTGVLWLVFGLRNFAAQGLEEPYIVYLLAGVVLMTFFSQTVMATGSTIKGQTGILSKVYVPAEVFAFASAIAGLVNFMIASLLLVVAAVVTGQGIAWTVALAPIAIICLLALVVGLGLLLASAAVWFYDVLDLTRVLLQLLFYMTPVFWTVSFLPDEFVPLVKLNPMFHYLELFRDVVYRGVIPPWSEWAIILAISAVALTLGAWVFTRSWKSLVVRL